MEKRERSVMCDSVHSVLFCGALLLEQQDLQKESHENEKNPHDSEL